MLELETVRYQPPVRVGIMSDMHILTASVVDTLKQISTQAQGLAKGLEEAAPGTSNISTRSVEYLYSVAEALKEITKECEKLQDKEPGSSHRPDHK